MKNLICKLILISLLVTIVLSACNNDTTNTKSINDTTIHNENNIETKTNDIINNSPPTSNDIITDKVENTGTIKPNSPADLANHDNPPDNMNAPINNPPDKKPPENDNQFNKNEPPNNSQPDSYNALNKYTENKTENGNTISSTGDDEIAILVSNNAEVVINDFVIERKNENSTGGDKASFYGVGATTLVTDGSLTLNKGTITSDAKGAAGVFAYDKGIAHINDVTINTNKDTSGGVHVAGGGKLYATNVSATTNGESSAAIRSDRGGGEMHINGGTFISNGSGSPALYCTANIEVNDAKLVSNNSEGICIEGLNTTTLNNVDLTSKMPDQSQNDTTWSVIVYQSMSGDSEIGLGTFNMENGSITSTNGGLFYTTNTDSEFNLKNVTLNPSNDFEFLLQVTGNKNKRGWGKAGANGANCTFNADTQILNGKIIYDTISTLTLNLTNNTIFTGSIIDDETYTNGKTGNGYANVVIDRSSKWIVTSDSVINELTLNGKLVDEDDNDIRVIDNDGYILREGTSDIYVTVNSFAE